MHFAKMLQNVLFSKPSLRGTQNTRYARGAGPA